MKFFLDSAHVHEIAHGLEMWNVDGVTTVLQGVQKEGIPACVVRIHHMSVAPSSVGHAGAQQNTHFDTSSCPLHDRAASYSRAG